MKRPYLTKEQIEQRIQAPDFKPPQFTDAQAKRLIEVLVIAELSIRSNNTLRS